MYLATWWSTWIFQGINSLNIVQFVVRMRSKKVTAHLSQGRHSTNLGTWDMLLARVPFFTHLGPRRSPSLLLKTIQMFSEAGDSPINLVEIRFLHYSCRCLGVSQKRHSQVGDVKYVIIGTFIPSEATKSLDHGREGGM